MRRHAALSPRGWRFVGSVTLLVSTAWIASTEQSGASQAAQTTFTGKVTPMDTADRSPFRIRFEPGARTYWHVHAGGQVLLAQEGRGRTQAQGDKMQDLVPGHPVFSPAGVPHWHGATPDQPLVQDSLNISDVKWLGPVSDAEYAGNKR